MRRIFVLFFVLVVALGQTFGQVDSYKATMKKMFEVVGTEANFKVAITQIVDVFKQQKTTVPDKVWSELENEFSKTSIDDLIDLYYPIYQKYLTEDDLKGIINFYQTPVGKKYAEKLPFILKESMQAGQQWGAKIGQKIKDKLKEDGY